MSLTATLLFNRPINLPSGQLITHNPDHKKKALTDAQYENFARSEAVRAANIERIYNAIGESDKPLCMAEIEAITKLSHATCFYGVATLEEWPGGARITRIKGTRHTFEVK